LSVKHLNQIVQMFSQSKAVNWQLLYM
jgi:hypothetical protein